MSATSSRDSQNPRIAIVGAGPAGLIAAEALAQAGCRVTVFERMASPARKFLIAGRGGLNLTHSEPREAFLARYGRAADWLAPMIDAFPPGRLRAFAEGLGQPTFVGSSGRVFPRAFKASPLLRAWLARLAGLGVELRLRHDWRGWGPGGDLLFMSPEGERAVSADATLLALGGASWPRLGSDGRWTALLEREGVALAPLQPANSGALIAWSEIFRTRFAGAPLKRIALSAEGATVRGEAVIAQTGLEGGAVYALSARLREAAAWEGRARLLVDLRPDLSLEALAARLSRSRKGESMANRLRKAAGLSPAAAGLLREAIAALPAEAEKLAALIKAVPLEVSGMSGLERAISSAGGISRSALDAGLMLRARPGNFAAGEMLDWEAPTGGYLLQGCFATGHTAACGMLAHLGLAPPDPWRGAWSAADVGETKARDDG
ncbi:TIGR03862 family flavoprotein [Ancylobacter sp. MQZ15Z-1]|uniref:TIGR03862 family flavoprotein n=1 Tax=Ancylobacter mangrovi TaxID=2972472 RepID=A0A9X2T507_9HYPH|nr:TIGR03862 family flavoprotein [Ancylobacter mangrovi]MCS0493538.1 TIGR03862 family flavoprotein [Ancylobacter mangrovi]